MRHAIASRRFLPDNSIGWTGSEASMNHSICSADRATHMKIVVMALFLATVVTGLSFFLHSSAKAPRADSLTLLKASVPMAAGMTTVVR
jgi:hypothetical protein